MTATCFALRYTQTNLVSNTAGVAPGTDPQLRRHSEQPARSKNHCDLE
jgi:hypothetical protein